MLIRFPYTRSIVVHLALCTGVPSENTFQYVTIKPFPFVQRTKGVNNDNRFYNDRLKAIEMIINKIRISYLVSVSIDPSIISISVDL